MADDLLLSIHDVCARVGLKKTSIYALMGKREFPLPVRIGSRFVRWHSREVEEWLSTRPRAENIGRVGHAV